MVPCELARRSGHRKVQAAMTKLVDGSEKTKQITYIVDG